MTIQQRPIGPVSWVQSVHSLSIQSSFPAQKVILLFHSCAHIDKDAPSPVSLVKKKSNAWQSRKGTTLLEGKRNALKMPERALSAHSYLTMRKESFLAAAAGSSSLAAAVAPLPRNYVKMLPRFISSPFSR